MTFLNHFSSSVSLKEHFFFPKGISSWFSCPSSIPRAADCQKVKIFKITCLLKNLGEKITETTLGNIFNLFVCLFRKATNEKIRYKEFQVAFSISNKCQSNIGVCSHIQENWSCLIIALGCVQWGFLVHIPWVPTYLPWADLNLSVPTIPNKDVEA